MKSRMYELSKFLSLESNIEEDGRRIIRNTYTGSRLEVTSEIVKILEQFKNGTTIDEAAKQLGIKTRVDMGKFRTLCQELISSTVMVEAATGEIEMEEAFCAHLDSSPLSVSTQTFANCPSKRLEHLEEGEIAILGVPLDTATSVQPGTRFGPDTIRETSVQYITYERSIFTGKNQGWFNADLGRAILTNKNMADVGNIVVRAEDDLGLIFGRISRCAEEFADRKVRSVTLGGDHSISAPIIRAYAKHNPHLAVLHFDAHTDLAAWVPEKPHHHGSFMRRVMEEVPTAHIYQYGARGFSGEKTVNTQYHFNTQNSLDRMFKTGKWESVLPQGKECYITLDVDVLDPAFAPGVGTPVPFGMTPARLLAMLEVVARSNNIVAIDAVELCPPNDRSKSTSNLVFHLLMNLMGWAWDK